MDSDKLFIEELFMDQDFKDRTVLHLISYNNFSELMSDPKVTVLLDNLWQGKLAAKCDGRVSDYSMLTFMANDPVRKLVGQNISFLDLLGTKFKPNVHIESYSVQYKFRKSSIATIFQKNFLSSIAIVAIFTYINLEYQQLFNLHQFEGASDEVVLNALTENL